MILLDERKINMKKIIAVAVLILAAFLLCMSSTAYATEYDFWFHAGCDDSKNSGDGGAVWYNSYSSRLQTGCFLQYIWIGPDGIPNPPAMDGGVSGDDVLILTGEVGVDEVWLPGFATREGEFYYSNDSFTMEASQFPQKIIVRAWSTYEADILSSAYYGNSASFDAQPTSTIPDEQGIPSFEASYFFDTLPPDSPTNFVATQAANGDLILTWTPTTEPSTFTRIVFRTNRAPTTEYDGTAIFNNINPSSGYRHDDLTDGQWYYYGAFSYDVPGNFSSPAVTNEESSDTEAPTVEAVSPGIGTTGIFTSSYIEVRFDDSMNTTDTQNAFQISYPGGSQGGSSSWFSYNGIVDRVMRFTPSGLLQPAETYTCTAGAGSKDDAGNLMGIDYVWKFTTTMGEPPTISDVKIGGWKRYSGDIISSQPRLTASLDDTELGYDGIATIEISADGFTYTYSTPEITDIYDADTGLFDFRFPGLPSGVYTITIEAWDYDGNSTTEAIAGLVVKSGAVKLETNVINYPNPFRSGEGTTFSYNLNIDSAVTIYVYGVKGSPIYKTKLPAGAPGGQAGYNEVYWDGLNNFEETIGNGVYIVMISAHGSKLGSARIVVQNSRN
ncbi:Ig-like domain-containing protein [Candidatus Margulisiibacteriota bacterium]